MKIKRVCNPAMCEYGTEPLIVHTEDGARWINVDDVTEIEYLLKDKIFLDQAPVKMSSKRSIMDTKSFDDLDCLPPVECKRADENDCFQKNNSNTVRPPGEAGDIPETANVCRVVSSIIDRLRDLQQRLLELRPSDSGMYDQYAIRNEKPPVVQAIDGSRWFNVADVKEVERIVEDESGKSDSTEKEVCVAITKLQVVAEKNFKSTSNKLSNKMKEKIVCVEYDVFTNDTVEPVKTMRAYLLIKSNAGHKNGVEFDTEFIPVDTKNDSDSMMRLSAKEIEMIDAEIRHKKGYLDELRNDLKTKPTDKLPNNKTVLTQANLDQADEKYTKLKRKSEDLSTPHSYATKKFTPKSDLMKDISKNTSATNTTKNDSYKPQSLFGKNRPKSPNAKKPDFMREHPKNTSSIMNALHKHKSIWYKNRTKSPDNRKYASTIAKELNTIKKGNDMPYGNGIGKSKCQRDTFNSSGILNKLKRKQKETSILDNCIDKTQRPTEDLDLKNKKEQAWFKNSKTRDVHRSKQFLNKSTKSKCASEKVIFRSKSSATDILQDGDKNSFGKDLSKIKSSHPNIRERNGKEKYLQFKKDLKELDSFNKNMDKILIGAF